LTAWAITRNTWRPGVLDYDKSIAAAGSCSPTGVVTSPGKKDKAKASAHGGNSTKADAGRVTYNAAQESVGVGK
jgi:hypothetical protein